MRELRSRLLLVGLCSSLLGCDAILGIQATPFVGDAGGAGDGGGSSAANPPEAGGATGADATIVDGAPDASAGMPDARGGVAEAGGPLADASQPPDADASQPPGADASQPPGADASQPPGADASASLLQDCVLLLHMDEASWSGSGAVIDSSGHGNNGTVVGTAQTTAGGKFGRAAQFGGAGYIDVPDSASLHASSALTMSAWIYPTGFTSDSLYPGIVTKRQDYALNSAYTMFLWTGYALWADMGTARSNSSVMIANNQGWVHVAVVYDGTIAQPTSRVSFYVNGVLDSASVVDGTTGASLPVNTIDLLVGYMEQGARDPDPNAYFIGLIDEVGVWTRALSAAEISALYTANSPL